MAEAVDVIVPILQRIQSDIAETKRDLGGGIDRFSSQSGGIVDRMENFENYFTFTMGLTSQNKADIAQLSAELKALQARVDGKDRTS
jgi:hypothetical protein